MPNSQQHQSVLILDDEPHFLEWLVQYLEAKGIAVEIATDLNGGEQLIQTKTYRFLVIDLNIPTSGSLKNQIAKLDVMHNEFPGLYGAEIARTVGYRARQIVVYSVHESENVRKRTDMMGVTYITKGRPKLLKEEIESILRFDPTRKPKRKRTSKTSRRRVK